MEKQSLPSKTIRLVKSGNWEELASKTRGYLGYRTEPLKRLLAPYALRELKRFDAGERDVDALVHFVFDRFTGLLRPYQIRREIVGLAEVVKQLQPKAIMEIGTARGGTLFLFARLAQPDATIVSVDLPGGEFGGGYPTWKVELYKAFALPAQRLELLRGDSHATETKQKVLEILREKSLDFLFIDGDHTYEGVKKDFDLYSPLVRKGGIIALHDIAEHPAERGCEVQRFWNEIKTPDSKEFIEKRDQQWAGIGVLYV